MLGASFSLEPAEIVLTEDTDEAIISRLIKQYIKFKNFKGIHQNGIQTMLNILYSFV